jgi:hypothetical protein
MSIIILNEYGLSTKHSNYKTELEEVAQVVDHLQVQGPGFSPQYHCQKKKKKKEGVRDGGRDLLYTYEERIKGKG